MIAGTSTTLFVSLCLYICLFLFVFCLFLFVCIFVTCISWVGDCISERMWAKLTISTKQSDYSWSTKIWNEPDSSMTKEFNNFYPLQKLDFLRCQKQAECSSSYFLKKGWLYSSIPPEAFISRLWIQKYFSRAFHFFDSRANANLSKTTFRSSPNTLIL